MQPYFQLIEDKDKIAPMVHCNGINLPSLGPLTIIMLDT